MAEQGEGGPPPQETQKSKPFLEKPLSRRDLLKGAGKLISAAAVTAVLRKTHLAKAQEPETHKKEPVPALSFEDQFAQEAQKKRKSFLDSLKAHETLQQINPHVLMIDFVDPSQDIDGLQKTDTPLAKSEFFKSMLKEKFIDEQKLIEEFGSDFYTNSMILYEKVFQKYPEVAMIYDVWHRFGNHGERVTKAYKQMLNLNGFDSDIYSVSLQNKLSPDNAQFEQFTSGEKAFFLTVDPDPIAQALKNSKQKIVNFSFQMGEVGFKYTEWEKVYPDIDIEGLMGTDNEGNDLFYLGAKALQPGEGNEIIGIDAQGQKIKPLTMEEFEKVKREKMETEAKLVKRDIPNLKLQDAYTPEHVKENLPKLFELCRQFPDKLFIAAAGNNVDDLRVVPKETWPPNLLTVAQWSNTDQKPYSKAYGADVYVDNWSLGIESGSSFSTPVISAVASVLLDQGLSIHEVKQKILSFCLSHSFRTNEEEMAAEVFDPRKLKRELERPIMPHFAG